MRSSKLLAIHHAPLCSSLHAVACAAGLKYTVKVSRRGPQSFRVFLGSSHVDVVARKLNDGGLLVQVSIDSTITFYCRCTAIWDSVLSTHAELQQPIATRSLELNKCRGKLPVSCVLSVVRGMAAVEDVVRVQTAQARVELLQKGATLGFRWMGSRMWCTARKRHWERG